MEGQGKLITGMIVGAGTMYLLDPDRGARRRSLLRDQGIHVGHKLSDGLTATARDTRNRTIGAAAELRSRFRREQPDSTVLHDRVRSTIGRLVSHPGALTVTVFEGRVTLTGQVLADELEGLLRGVGKVRGVEEVQNELEVFPTADGMPAPQGGEQYGQRPDPRQKNWAPATRVAIATVGGLLALKGVRTRGVPGQVMSVIGLSLLTRAASNLSARRLVALARGERGFDIEKTIQVGAAANKVWELWSNFESFPRFMAHLKEVRKLDEGRSHWVAAGPAGVPVEWDAVVTDWVPNQFIGWTSVEGSPVETSGQVRLQEVSPGETQIDIHMVYSPPAGVAGHALASLLGADPRSAMDEDLLRFKSLLEEQQTATPEGTVRLEDVAGDQPAGRARRVTRSRRKS
jgi:uncharacterized membrane protein